MAPVAVLADRPAFYCHGRLCMDHLGCRPYACQEEPAAQAEPAAVVPLPRPPARRPRTAAGLLMEGIAVPVTAAICAALLAAAAAVDRLAARIHRR